MLDILMVISTVAFFLLAVVYTVGCDRLNGKSAAKIVSKDAGNA
ncbi:MAG: hypothetical protein WBM14_19230 [Terracidiphilus sp.]|jgi:hypothetical protein